MFLVVLFVEEDSWVLGLGLGSEEELGLLTNEGLNGLLGVDHPECLRLLEDLVGDLVGESLFIGDLGVFISSPH